MKIRGFLIGLDLKTGGGPPPESSETLRPRLAEGTLPQGQSSKDSCPTRGHSCGPLQILQELVEVPPEVVASHVKCKAISMHTV